MLKNAGEEQLVNVAFVLAILTIVFGTLEGSFSVYYGYETNSLTLFGNGIASFIEVISGFGVVGMIIRIRKHTSGSPNTIEKAALRITGTGLYLLAGSLVVMGVANMINHQHPDTTISGIIIAIVTIIVIGALVWAKMLVGKTLHSKALIADAKCTRICVSMSTMVLFAGVIYELTKFEYADAIGAIGLAYFAYREAKECFKFE